MKIKRAELYDTLSFLKEAYHDIKKNHNKNAEKLAQESFSTWISFAETEGILTDKFAKTICFILFRETKECHDKETLKNTKMENVSHKNIVLAMIAILNKILEDSKKNNFVVPI